MIENVKIQSLEPTKLENVNIKLENVNLIVIGMKVSLNKSDNL